MMDPNKQFTLGYQAIPTRIVAMEALLSDRLTLENYDTGETLKWDPASQSFKVGEQAVSEQRAQNFLTAALPGNLMAHTIQTLPMVNPNV